MPTINRQDLQNKQSELLASQQAARAALARIKTINKEINSLEQAYAKAVQLGQNAGASSKRAEIEAKANEKAAQLALFNAAEAELIGKITELQDEPDPRSLTALMDDQYPILLLPVRVETRFMTIKHIARLANASTAGTAAVNQLFSGRNDIPVIEDRKELWVRIFPDDLFVQSHEEALTDEEITAAKAFWENMWEVYNFSLAQEKDESNEDYQARYQATVDNNKLATWRMVISSRGQERAAWIVQRLTPSNVDELPETDFENANPPDFPTELALKNNSWTQAPQTELLPDRFVVKLVSGTKKREIVGKPIANPLYLNISPEEEKENIELGEGEEEGQLKFPEQLKWLTDFHEAEKVGMAIRIPLLDQEATTGFDRVLVLGIKHTASAATGKALLEELLDNHCYTSGGLAILPQGTKTNNDQDSGSGYSALEETEENYQKIALQSPFYEETQEEYLKKDGQRLTELLGLDASLGKRIINGGQADISEAMAMNRALWPLSFGYYLSQMLFPLVSNGATDAMRSFFEQHVLGRGNTPAIRIDDQPYGILVASAYKKWAFSNLESDTDIKDKFFRNLLLNMETAWAELADKVVHANSAGDPDDVFLSIMSSHASSVEFYQRSAIGRLFLWNLHLLVNTINEVALPDDFDEVQDINTLDFFEQFAWLDRTTTVPPNIFDLIFTQTPQLLNGAFIDELPFSEERELLEFATGWNYLRWLQESSYQEVFKEDFSRTGSPNAKPPTALFYLLTRHALLLAYQNAGVKFLEAEGILATPITVDKEITNIGDLSLENKTESIRRFIVQEEMTIQADLIHQEGVEFLGNFNGTEVEYTEAMETFRLQRIEELAPELQTAVDERVNKLDLDLVGLSTSEIFNREYGELTNEQTLAEYIETLLADQHPATDHLRTLKAAIGQLQSLPTARLERCLAEHIDLSTYRLDAWFQGFAAERLKALRKEKAADPGTYLGAFSWLLDLRPGSFSGIHYEEVSISQNDIQFPQSPELSLEAGTTNTPAPALALTGEQKLFFNQKQTTILVNQPDLTIDSKHNASISCVYLGPTTTADATGPLKYDDINDQFIAGPQEDPANQGFIHAPSINQATAAAVLRAAYESHKGAGTADNAYAVNLSSNRTRRALYLLEGVRNGQELGALLGYQFERYLNDRSTVALNLNAVIYDLRAAFPQIEGSVTESDGTTTTGEAAAYNVIDGLKLLEKHREEPGTWSDGIDFGSNAIKKAIEEGIDYIADCTDAIYDLMMAESIFQVAQGNDVRAGAALKVVNGTGSYMEPEVIKTPRNYHILTHRLGVQFDQNANGESVWSKAGLAFAASPRSIAAPRFNHWLSTLLPDPEQVIININYTHIPDGAIANPATEMSLADLEIQPIDFYYLMLASEQGTIPDGLTKRLSYFVKTKLVQADDAAFTFDFKQKVEEGQFNLFSLAALFHPIKKMVGRARLLTPEDVLLPSETDQLIADHPEAGWDTAELIGRLKRFLSEASADKDISLLVLANELETVLAKTDAIDKTDLSAVDLSHYSELRDHLRQFAAFHESGRHPNSDPLDAATINRLDQQGKSVLDSMTKRINDAKKLIVSIEDAETDKSQQVKLCQNLGQVLFGKSFMVFPHFKQYAVEQFTVAYHYEHLLDDAGPDPINKWFRDLAKTNAQAKSWRMIDLLTDGILQQQVLQAKVVQLPLLPINEQGFAQTRWVGAAYPEDYEIADENLSLVFQYPNNFDAAQLQAGFVVDDWNEEIPIKDMTTGMAIHYNSPNSEPPQACIIAISPTITGNWSWDDLMDTLEETIDWAKKRGVHPDLLDETPYAQVLPSIMTALASSGDNLTLDLKRNIISNPNPGSNNPILLRDHQLIVTEGINFTWQDFELNESN